MIYHFTRKLLENMTDRFPHIPDFAWISHALPLKTLIKGASDREEKVNTFLSALKPARIRGIIYIYLGSAHNTNMFLKSEQCSDLGGWEGLKKSERCSDFKNFWMLSYITKHEYFCP